jgi:DNA invertase Pin-like site-specific DNA recombinase/thiol-disulfide isomerase/thioredoxin
MPRYLLYSRKSTESEDRQVLSIDSQIAELQDLARERQLDVVAVHRESRSAKAPGREVFGQVLADVAKGRVDGLLCWKLDRLARNPVDGGALIWAFDEGKVREIVTPGRTFTNTGNDKFWMSLEFGMAKKYVDDLSENVKRGNRAKLAQGWRPGNAPIGYLNDLGTKTIVPDPDRMIRHLFGFSRSPATYVVEKHGVAVFHEEGFDEGTAERLAALVARLLDMPQGVIRSAGEDSEPTAIDEESEEPPQVLLYPGDGVPSFTAVDTFGGEHPFDWPSESEEVTVVFFWGDPCRPCIEEMIFLDQIYRRAVDMGLSLQVLAVEAGGLDAAGAEEVMKKYRRFYPQPAFPIALDSRARLTGIFGRGELPTTFIIDGRGIVIEVHQGFDRKRGEEWTRLIENALPRAQGVLRRRFE